MRSGGQQSSRFSKPLGGRAALRSENSHGERRNTMNTAKHTVSNIKRRSLSALLALVMCLSLVPAANADFQGGMKGNAYNTITVYKWHRVHKQSDLPPEGQKVPVLLMWKGQYEDSSDKNEYMFYLYQDLSGTDSYHAHGEDALKGRTFDANKYEVQPFNTNSDYDVFYTLDKLSNIEVRMNSGRDSKNQDAKYGKIWFNNYIIKGDGDFDWGGYGAEDASRTNWSFYTKELNGKYAAPCTDETPLQIYYERGGWYDTGIRHSGQWVYAFEDDTYSFGSFAMYWGEKITISAITEDYTVHSGMVMNVDNGVLLTDNHTITVMPGGVLSIEGQFYNNGTIQNYGTVILQPDACITSFLPQSSSAGTIVNSGGVVNVAEDAKQTLPLREAERAALQAEIDSQKESLTAQNNTIAQKEVEKERLLLEVDEVTKLPLTERLENLKAAIDNAYALYDQTLTSVPSLLEEAKKGILDGRTMDQLSQTEKNQIAKLESDAAKALEENEATYEKDKKAYQEQYDKLNKPVEAINEQITAAKVSMSATQTLIEENTERLDRLSEQITRLKDLAKGANANVRGEGNLVVMENARIIFNANSNCKLIVKDGGSCVCSGYMVLPHELTLNNSKLQIRKGGAMAIGYYFKYGLLNAQNLKPSNPTNVNFDFGPMYTWGNRASTAIWASGDYVIEVDGVLKYANGNGIYNTDTGQRDSIYLGKGVWNTSGMPSRKIDENGVEINTDAKGNTTRTYPDGATEYYNAITGVTTLLRANGNIVVTNRDGTSKETWATPKTNGEENYITRNADGSYNKVSVETDEYKMWLDDNGTLVTEYKTKQKNDLVIKREYKNGDLEEEFAGGKRVRYDSTGGKIADYEVDPSGKFGIYSYTDRVEIVLANGKTKSIEYIAGLYAGAKIEYDPLDEGVRDWWERQCAWTVTSARGGVTRCYVEEIDGVKCSVICFAGGLTCTRPSEEVDATYFKYESSLGGAPSGYLYDAKPYVITMWDTGVALDNGTTRYQRTDGTYLIYANVKDPATGEVKSVVVGKLTPAGTGIMYETSFYEKSATQHEEGELLWTVIATNGDVTTARAYGKGDDRLALFFTGENAGKSRTMKIADADPEDYLESASAATYDESLAILTMPESRAVLTNGNIRYTRTDGTTVTYTYKSLWNAGTNRNEDVISAIERSSGEKVVYSDAFYTQKPADVLQGTIMWTVHARDGGTVIARAVGSAAGTIASFTTDASGRGVADMSQKTLVLYFDDGKTKTVEWDHDPENYVVSATSESYDAEPVVLPMPEAAIKTLGDGGKLTKKTNGEVLLCYDDGSYGEVNDGGGYPVYNKNGVFQFWVTEGKNDIVRRNYRGELYTDLYKNGRLYQRVYDEYKNYNEYYGAVIEYADAFYKPVSARRKADALWIISPPKEGREYDIVACETAQTGKADVIVWFTLPQDRSRRIVAIELSQAPDPEKFLGNYENTEEFKQAKAAATK